MHMQTCFRKKENRRAYQCGERLICREYTKIHDVFNVHFQNVVEIYSVGRKTVIAEYCSKSRIPRAILTENERNHHVLHVILLKGVAWMMISQLWF